MVSRFNERAARPPLWVRVVVVPAFALVALGLADQRGWLVGILAAVVYGAVALPTALDPDATVAWSRRHPLLDGAVLGPLVFLALAYLTRWPLWICLIIGLVGIALGVGLGARRARRRSSSA